MQGGLPVTTGALTLRILPQLSVMVGGVGIVTADKQAAVEVVLAGMVTTGAATVIVCVQV